MAGRRMGRPPKPRNGGDEKPEREGPPAGLEFAEPERHVEEDPDAAFAEQALTNGSAPGRKRKRLAPAEHLCPVCRKPFHDPGDVRRHLETYPTPGFTVGAEVRCRKRRDLMGSVLSIETDHLHMMLNGIKYQTKAFEAVPPTRGAPARASR